MNVVRKEDIRVWAASILSHVSLARHVLKKPFTILYEGADVAIASSQEIHFKDVISPGAQFKRADLTNQSMNQSINQSINQ